MVVFSEKVKFTLEKVTKAQIGSRGIALLIHDLGTRRGRVVSTTPQPFYPWERPGTHCTGGRVGPRAGLDMCGKFRPHGNFFIYTVFIHCQYQYSYVANTSI
jgi:hypothetical protein